MIINRVAPRTFPLLITLRIKDSAMAALSPISIDLGAYFGSCLGLRKGPFHGSATKIVYNYRSDDAYIDFRKNYYQILGVAETATHQEIKQQFYLLAKEHHPDKASGNQSYFKEINQAYKVLSQPKLKQEYDAHHNHQSTSTSGSQQQHINNPQRPLNYDPYSQMSRAEWSYYRRGSMKLNKTDYTNYQRSFDPEKNLEIDFKTQQQWNRAFRSITREQVRQQNDFREKIFRKYVADKKKRRQERQQFFQNKLQELGSKVQRFLGKGARRFFEKLIQK